MRLMVGIITVLWASSSLAILNPEMINAKIQEQIVQNIEGLIYPCDHTDNPYTVRILENKAALLGTVEDRYAKKFAFPTNVVRKAISWNLHTGVSHNVDVVVRGHSALAQELFFENISLLHEGNKERVDLLKKLIGNLYTEFYSEGYEDEKEEQSYCFDYFVIQFDKNLIVARFERILT